MKHNTLLAGIFGIMLVFGIVLVGCDNGTTKNNDNNSGSNSSGSLLGTWGGSINGKSILIAITSTGWTLSGSGYSDYGVYFASGSLASKRFGYNLAIGTAVVINNNSISVTLNASSVVPPGTYTLYRQ
jgi:hypothetical protein